ncbi:MAG: hypothetical protein AAF716_23565 [Cyanobacteria bacterium P01_D01_bin.1]
MTNQITRKLLSAGFILSTALFPVLGAASPAEAATRHCKKVNLEVINNSGEEIRILDIDYYDVDALGDWRSEPIANTEVADGEIWEKTRRLESVNQENTQVVVEYQTRNLHGSWGRRQEANSSWQVCSRGATYTMTIN